MHRIFVYGSLKSDKPDTHLAAGLMYSVQGRFPAAKFGLLSPNPSNEIATGTISGQVIEVDDKELARLDRIECEGHLYRRRRINVLPIYEEEPEEVWAYEWIATTNNLEHIAGWPAVWSGPKMPWSPE